MPLGMWDLNSWPQGLNLWWDLGTHGALLWSWQLLTQLWTWEILVTRAPWQQGVWDDHESRSFPGHLLVHIWTISTFQINKPSSGSPVWIKSQGEWCHLILLESDLLGPGRGCVYFGKGQTFHPRIPLPPKVVLGDDHKLSIFLTHLSCQTDYEMPRGHLWLLCPWQNRPPGRFRRPSQKPLGLRAVPESFLTCVT